MNLLEDLDVCDREITRYEVKSNFIPMIDKMEHLEESADPTDPSMMIHRQMPGAAIVIFLKD